MKRVWIFVILPLLISVFFINERVPFIDRETANEMPAIISRVEIYKQAISEGTLLPLYSQRHFRGTSFAFYNLQSIPLFIIALLSFIFDIVISVKVLFMITIFLAGYFAFLFFRENFDEKTAIAGAVLYQITPQIILHMNLMGQVSVSFFMAFIPLVLFIISRNSAPDLKSRVKVLLVLLLIFFIDNQRFAVFIPFIVLFILYKKVEKPLWFVPAIIALFLPIALFVLFERSNIALFPSDPTVSSHYSLKNILFMLNLNNVFGLDLNDPTFFEADIKYISFIPVICFFLFPFKKKFQKYKYLYLFGLFYLNLSSGNSPPIKIFNAVSLLDHINIFLIIVYSFLIFFKSYFKLYWKILVVLLFFIPLFPVIKHIPPFNLMRAPIYFFDILLPFIFIWVFLLFIKKFRYKWIVVLFIILESGPFLKYFFEFESRTYANEKTMVQNIMGDNSQYFSFSPYFNENNFISSETYSNIFSFLAFKQYAKPFRMIHNFDAYIDLLRFCGTEYVVLRTKKSKIKRFNDDIENKKALFGSFSPEYAGSYIRLFKLNDLHTKFMGYKEYFYVDQEYPDILPISLYMLKQGHVLISKDQKYLAIDRYGKTIETLQYFREIGHHSPETVKYEKLPSKRNRARYNFIVNENMFIKTTFSHSPKIEFYLNGNKIENSRTAGIFCGFFAEKGDHILDIRYKDAIPVLVLFFYLLTLLVFIFIIIL